MSLADDIASLTGLTYWRWNSEGPVGTPIIVTFTFPTAPSAADPYGGFIPFSDQHKAHARTALATWGAAAGIEFIEVPETAGGQIRFSMVNMAGGVNAVGNQISGLAYFPRVMTSTFNGVTQSFTTANDIGGDVFMNSQFFAADGGSMAPGQRGFSILIHEIGHALGFKHPFEGTPVIETAHDNASFTVLSYNRSNSTTQLGSVDIAAAQFFYGAQDAAYSWNPATLSLTILGTDAAEARIGTELSDIINALAGDDLLVGKRGADTLNGAEGFDTALYSGPLANYSISLAANGSLIVKDLRPDPLDGDDTLINVEQLRFTNAAVAVADIMPIAAAATNILGSVATAARGVLQSQVLNKQISFTQYVDSLVLDAQRTSTPALIVANELGGAAPSKDHLASLMEFAGNQLAAYRAMGVATPEMGPYEALGRGFAATEAFRAKYAAMTQSDFVKTAYRAAFERDGNATQLQHFDQQVTYFTGIYQGAGVSASESALLARGAVFGQMYGHAVRDEASLHAYDEAASAFLRAAATGQANYGQPLDLI